MKTYLKQQLPTMQWINHFYTEHKLQLWMAGCPNVNTCMQVITRKTPYKQASKIKIKEYIEHQFATIPYYAYMYATNILNDRWLRGEPALLTEVEWLYWYVHMLSLPLSDWPEAENVIINQPEWALEYARFDLRARWPEAELIIMNHPECAVWYAYNMIKGRWPEAEPIIMKNPSWATKYASYVIEGPWPEAEPYIAGSATDSYFYAIHILGKRWLPGESAIATIPLYKSRYERYYSCVIR